MKNPDFYNHEGYADPTAYFGAKDAGKKLAEANVRSYELIKVLKYIINAAGFDLMDRIQIRDRKTGREYR